MLSTDFRERLPHTPEVKIRKFGGANPDFWVLISMPDGYWECLARTPHKTVADHLFNALVEE